MDALFVIFSRFLFDFGLVVLIWMVQLVVYPSFVYYKKENLISWHKKYTKGISYVVIPLMFGQLIVVIWQLFKQQSIYTLLSVLLVIVVWLITFLIFVPIHNKISAGDANEMLLQQLVQRNWFRTILWTVIFVLSLIEY